MGKELRAINLDRSMLKITSSKRLGALRVIISSPSSLLRERSRK